MSRPAESTDRAGQTRERLREAAFARFAMQGFERTSVAEIAADAGVSERTFYRYFPTKEHSLFADYEQELGWFRIALQVRPRHEPVSTAVMNASAAFPHTEALYDISRLRSHGIDVGMLRDHLRRVQASFADEIEAHLMQRASARTPDELLRARITAQTLSGALFSALELWLGLPEQSLDELSRLSEIALKTIADGIS